ncbi:rhomboid family intramembrane serine protease [Myxococcota bacterium]|nr:rhomboid family intramembrane serine protease [Myxococcota bacterium]
MAQREGSILCPSCRKLIHSSEPSCPYCGATAPGLVRAPRSLDALIGPDADTSLWLVGAVAGMYVLSLVLDPSAVTRTLQSFSLYTAFAPSGGILYTLGMTGGIAIIFGGWWTVLTSSFLHASLVHVAFELMWTRSIGQLVASYFGPARLLVLWFVTGAIGHTLYNLLSDQPLVGADANICGLLGALIAFGRRRGGAGGAELMKRMTVITALFLGMPLLFGASLNTADLGGFATGLVLGSVMPMADQARETRAVQLTALAFIGLTVLGVMASAVRLGPMMLGGP